MFNNHTAINNSLKVKINRLARFIIPQNPNSRHSSILLMLRCNFKDNKAKTILAKLKHLSHPFRIKFYKFYIYSQYYPKLYPLLTSVYKVLHQKAWLQSGSGSPVWTRDNEGVPHGEKKKFSLERWDVLMGYFFPHVAPPHWTKQGSTSLRSIYPDVQWGPHTLAWEDPVRRGSKFHFFSNGDGRPSYFWAVRLLPSVALRSLPGVASIHGGIPSDYSFRWSQRPPNRVPKNLRFSTPKQTLMILNLQLPFQP